MSIYYETYGQGQQTLVLLHSGGMAGVEWAPQIPAFAKRYRVLVPDLPGHGKSLLPGDKLSVEIIGNAILGMLDKENVEAAHIVGSSLGAATAMWLTLNYPARIKKAVFYRISYAKNAGTYAQTRKMADPEYWRQFGLQQWLSKLHEPQGGGDAWQRVIARVSEALDPATSSHQHHLTDFAALKQPVLLVVGDRDPVAPLADVLELYHTIPDCGLWVLPYATHITATNTWRAPAFAEEVIRFLGRSKG